MPTDHEPPTRQAVSTVVELFEQSSSALVFDDATTATARQLASDGRRVAASLNAMGWERGDRLAVHLPNGREYVTWLLACAAGGFVAVSVNTRYAPAEVDELIERAGARRPPDLAGFDTPPQVNPVSAPADSAITLPAATSDGATSGDVINGATIGGADDGFVVFTTSGTTSRPKMVLHRQHSIARHAADVARHVGYSPAETVLVAMPLCGTFGLTSMMAAVAGGATTIVTDYDRARTARLVAEHRVTALNASDDLFHRLLDDGDDVSSIRIGGYARFNTSLDGIVERADAAGATLTGLYGMSEVQALFAVRSPDGSATERERAGGTLSSPDAEYRIVDGELQVRGPSLFAGYLAEGGDRIDDELTASAFDQTAIDIAWFRTGDVAAADDDRTFHYLSRAGDMLRLGGFLVNPGEIEAVIADQPGVEAVQVVAHDDARGSRAVGFVIAPSGIDEEAVLAACRQQLARYKVPVRVFVVEAFPSTPGANGTKIQAVELRRLADRLLNPPPTGPDDAGPRHPTE